MTHDTRNRLAEAFERLVATPAHARDAVLDAECDGDAALRAELASLVAAHERAGDFLERPASEILGPSPAAPLAPGTRVAAYRIVRPVASGGSGIVYEAEQANPQRRVALKVMRAGGGFEFAARRFRDEAQILARLDHPAVAHVYEAGIHRDGGAAYPWIAMEFVAGAKTIVEFAEAAELSTRKRLELFETAARAVHHGHQKGIVHRDVKPANVLVDEAGRVKVIDFGIANAEGLDGAPRLAGTLPYMAPEQCAAPGADADVRSDVHALGVLLFELLTGGTPFETDGLPLAQALHVVRDTEAPPVSRADPALCGDVDAIVAKALSKDPERRYASAAAFADDVRRHLNDEPVEAMPPSLAYQARKFARRRRALFAAGAAVVVVSLSAAAVSGWFAVRADRERRTAEFQACVANLAAASAALRADDVAEAALRLERVPAHLRMWEWRHLHDRLDRSARTLVEIDGQIVWGAASARGSAFAATCIRSNGAFLALFGGAGGPPVRMIPLDAGDARPNALAMSPDGTTVVVGYDSGFLEFRSATQGDVVRRLRAHDDRVVAAVFDPAGRRVATSSRDLTVKLWDAAGGGLVTTLAGHADRVVGLAFSKDGARLATGGRDGTVRVFDVASGTPIVAFAPHDTSVEAVAFSPDGRRLATVSRDLLVRLSDASTGAPLAVARGHTRNVRDVAFSPDGRFVVTSSYDRTLRVWDASDLRAIACLRGHRRAVYSIAFVDATHLVSFSMDGTAKLWDVAAGERIESIPGGSGETYAFAMSPDGSLAASVDPGGVLSIRDIASRTEIGHRELATRHAALCVAFGRGAGSVLTAEQDGNVRSWSLPQCAPLATVRSGARQGNAAADGTRVVLALPGGSIESLDAETGRLVASWRTGGADAKTLAIAGHGVVVSSSTDGTLAVWREGSPDPEASSRPHAGTALALAADDRHVAASWQDGTVLLLDRRSLAVVAELDGHLGWVPGIAFSPDGTRVATGGHDETVRLWDAATGAQMLVLDGPVEPVWRVAWSADGNSLGSAEGATEIGGTIRVWHADPAAPAPSER